MKKFHQKRDVLFMVDVFKEVFCAKKINLTFLKYQIEERYAVTKVE
ncbi:hypothetical protein [Clostridium botulinum]|nr:hypothetical protein [Clostridium botulinum]